MAEATTMDGRIATMPRGGTDATWLDPAMQIEALPSSPRFGPLATMFSRPDPTARRQP